MKRRVNIFANVSFHNYNMPMGVWYFPRSKYVQIPMGEGGADLVQLLSNSLPQVIMIHMRNISGARADLGKQLIRKMAPPLVTLVSSAPEVNRLGF